MLTKSELWEKASTKEHITLEDIGIPSWRRDCDGYYCELESLLFRSGIAYKHKDGFRWLDGSFLTKKQCSHYGLETGIYNT